jgi:hypothetical protein
MPDLPAAHADEPRVRLAVDIPQCIATGLVDACVALEVSRDDLIRTAIVAYLDVLCCQGDGNCMICVAVATGQP